MTTETRENPLGNSSHHHSSLAAVVLFAVMLAACSRAPKSDFTEYPMLEKTDIPTAIAVAPDGTVWFTLDFAPAIGRIREGKVERLPLGNGKRNNVEPLGLGVDAGGTVWYTDPLDQAITSINPAGEFKQHSLQTPIARLGRLAVAADGAVWFAEGTAYSITRLKDGKITRHVIDNIRGGPYGVAVDAQGNAWATLQGGNQILKIAPDGKMTEHEVPTRASSPTDVTVDAKGAVWFVEFRGSKVGRLADGAITEFDVPSKSWAGLSGISAAPDGSVWFGALRDRALGRVRDGQVKMFPLPREDARPYTVAVDAKGNVWYADISGYVGMLAAEAARK
jgi:virginiamycin B lyase